jgi:DNA-binding NarL/FixJ family response regulator
MPINVLIFCKVYLFSEGIKSLIHGTDDIKIIGIASNIDDLEEMLKLDPDIIVSDNIHLVNTKKELKNKNEAKILLINNDSKMPISYNYLHEMVSKGLAGILQTNSNSEILIKAIHSLYSGEIWIDHTTIAKMLSNFNDADKVRLTTKETEVLNYIKVGLSNKNIAQKLCVSEQTIKTHCNHLFKKFGVKNRVKLALLASRVSLEYSGDTIDEN